MVKVKLKVMKYVKNFRWIWKGNGLISIDSYLIVTLEPKKVKYALDNNLFKVLSNNVESATKITENYL